MDNFQLVALALIQGLTEFLPVSSSAHLILPSQILGWPDQGLAFDVAVHAGTLVAVLLYYRQTLQELLIGAVRPDSGTGSAGRELRRLELLCLFVATLPVIVVGFLFSQQIDHYLRGTGVIAGTTLIFGVLLGLAYRYRGQGDHEASITRVDHALMIGFAQVFALIPGTSRSGVTISAGLFLGHSVATSARFSFLLSIPVIGGALLLMLIREAGGSIAASQVLQTLLAAAVAGASAYATIAFFVNLVNRVGMMPFVVYRLLLAILLFALILFG